MMSTQKKLGLAFLGSLTAMSLVATAAQAGNFSSSCKNIQLHGYSLTARCKDHGGRYRDAHLQLKGIHNNNGKLVYSGGNERSSFNNSCTGYLRGNDLYATCKRNDGSLSRTRMALPVANNYGRLVQY